LSTYNRLQSDSHFRRRENLTALHKEYKKFVTNECCPDITQIFNDYNEWIKQRLQMINTFESIEKSYHKHCDDIMNYVEMIDNLRRVVYRNIRELGCASTSLLPLQHEYVVQPSTTPIRHEQIQLTEFVDNNQQLNIDDESDKRNIMDKIRGTTKKTIQNAEASLNQLDDVIKQLRNNIRHK
jgi:hypothetical protein